MTPNFPLDSGDEGVKSAPVRYGLHPCEMNLRSVVSIPPRSRCNLGRGFSCDSREFIEQEHSRSSLKVLGDGDSRGITAIRQCVAGKVSTPFVARIIDRWTTGQAPSENTTQNEQRRLLPLMLRARVEITASNEQDLTGLKARLPVRRGAVVWHHSLRGVRFPLVGGELRPDENCVLRVRTPKREQITLTRGDFCTNPEPYPKA